MKLSYSTDTQLLCQVWKKNWCSVANGYMWQTSIIVKSPTASVNCPSLSYCNSTCTFTGPLPCCNCFIFNSSTADVKEFLVLGSTAVSCYRQWQRLFLTLGDNILSLFSRHSLFWIFQEGASAPLPLCRRPCLCTFSYTFLYGKSGGQASLSK